MPADHIMMMLGRLDVIARRMDEIMGQLVGLRRSLGHGIFRLIDSCPEAQAIHAKMGPLERELRGLADEARGMLANIVTSIEEYGRSVRENLLVRPFFEERGCTPEEFIGELHVAIGFLRGEALRL